MEHLPKFFRIVDSEHAVNYFGSRILKLQLPLLADYIHSSGIDETLRAQKTA